MHKTEIKEFDAKIKAYGKRISSSKKKSEDFLYKLGIITKEGFVSEPYKNLCIQQDQV